MRGLPEGLKQETTSDVDHTPRPECPYLIRSPSHRAVYNIHVYTSDVKNAGTDASISIEIFGEKATSGKQPLLDM